MPAVEVLLNTTHIAELIEQGRLSEIKRSDGQQHDAGLADLRGGADRTHAQQQGLTEDALANSDSPTNLLWLLENRGNSTEVPTARSRRRRSPQIVFPSLPVEPATPTFTTPAIDRRSALEDMAAATGPGAADAARARGAGPSGFSRVRQHRRRCRHRHGAAGTVTGAAGNGNGAGAALPRTAATPATPGAAGPAFAG